MGGPFALPPHERERSPAFRNALPSDLAKKAINFAFVALGKTKPFKFDSPKSKEGMVVASPLTDSVETEDGTLVDHALRKNLPGSSKPQDPYLN